MHPAAPSVRGSVTVVALSLALVSSLVSAPVISEIHYHPPHADLTPEPVSEEWIEIHNPDGVPVEAGGWQLTSGVTFTIPAPRAIPPGGYLVVSANVAAFLAAHPGFAGTVVGGWTGQLSNGGEKITLADGAGVEVDTVDYADEGDWALRGRGPVVAGWAGHQGWDWFTGADGLGRTKELIRIPLRKNSGQNWADSTAAGGTPGAVNSVNAANVAPVILAAQHRPQIPRSTDAVTVSAKITDDNAAATTATLRWRLDGAGSFASLPMTDPDGDGEYSAAIPPQANLAIVEWYVSASDGTLSRTWPAAARTSNPGAAPETFAQACNALYQVDNSYDPAVPWTPGAQPVYRLVMTSAERAELLDIQENDDSQTIQIDAAMNVTFVATDGTGQDTRHRASVRNRGFSSRSGPPNHFAISFVSGEEWAGRGSFQMNCRYPHAAILSAAIFQLGGMPVQEGAAAQLRVNGLNPAISGQGVGTFQQGITNGAFARTESLGGDWAANHYPNDDGGNLYRVDDHEPGSSGASNRFQYPGSSNPGSYESIYRKQTNQDQNDYSDLAALFQALNDSTSNSATFAANLRARANVEQWLTYIALDSLVGNMEGGITTGRTDDFSMYRGLVDQRFVLVPHDFDTTLGQNSPNGLNRSIFSHVPGLTGMVRLFNEPEFVHLYYRKTVELCESVFNNGRLDPLLDEVLAGWPVNPPVAAMKTWIGQRRTNVLNQIPQVNSFVASTGITTGNATLIDGMKQSPDGAATFSGQFNVAQVQSVMLNGQAATLQWRTGAGTWSYAATAANNFLKRGPNRVNILYYSGMNGTGSVVYSATVDVYNAAGTTTAVNADGTTSTILPGNLQITAPSSYIPGIPFLVGLEYRTSDNVTDKTQWTKTVTLTANNGVTLSSAGTGGGAANVTLYNGRGSLLVNAGGGATGGEVVLLNGRNTAGSITPAGATPATWSYYTAAAEPVANWFDGSTTLTGWQTGPPVFYRNETGLTGTNITSTNVSWALRTTFNVTNPAQYSSAKIRVQRDDGVKVYLNGVFLAANGLLETDGWTTVSTNAIAAAQETAWVEFTLPVASLIDGANTIAVEVHNNSGSNDQRLNCEITAVPTVAGPSDPGNFTLTGAVDGLNATKAMTSLGVTPVLTNKSGTLAGSETWSGVINVTGDVTVPAGATLTISPGTHVLMAGTAFGGGGTGGADLIVQGALSAPGTLAQPISITCANAANRWGEINFTTATASTMNYCLVSRACHSPGGGHTNTGPMVRLAGTALTLNDSIFSDSPGKTMTNTGNASLTVRRSIFARGVMGPELDGSAISIEDSLISDMLPANRESGAADDEDCIYIDDSGGRPVNLTRSVFANCGDDVLDFLGGSVTIEDCIVRNGFDKGISALANNIILRRTQIIDCDIGFSAKISGGQESTPFTNTVESCTIVCENHPTNTGDGTFHSIGLHTRNKNNTATANIIWNVKNTIISAEEPVANDYPSVGSTAFGGMNFTYCCYHDLGGTNPANTVPAGTGNITGDPLYTASATKNFKITGTSPGRDTGDPAQTDSDGSRIDMGALPFSSSSSTPTNIIWSLAGSPYRVSQATTIAAGTTLTVEPGVNVYFDQNVRLTVRGRMNAVGTPNARIRFSHVPGTNVATDVDPIKNGTQTGAPKWGGIRVYDSMAAENVFRYCDFVNAQGTDPTTAENYGSLGFIRSWGWADNLTFAGTHLRMCYARNSKMTVTHCNFPDMFIFDPAVNRVEVPTTDFIGAADNRMEPLKVEYPTTDAELSGQTGAGGTFPNGLPRNGHWRCYYNDFHGNRGHQDVFDADSGRWSETDAATGYQTNGQFMLDCRYNTFWGISGDEHIDLGGDAFIASNRFYTGSKDQWTIDTGYSNAISSGDKGSGTTIVVARNVFYDLDHAINLKINTATIFEHNTCVDFHQDWIYDHTVQQDVRCAAVNLYVPNDGNAAGDGAYVGYNIFYGNSVAPDDTVNPDPVGGFPRIFSWPDVTTTGAKTSVLRIENNFVDDRILDTNIGQNHAGGLFAPAWGFGNVQGNPLFTDKANRDFSLAPNSPAKGTAAGGLDFGATVGEWVYLLNVPPAQTPSTSAAITVGGPGMVAYKWRLDGGAWSPRIQIGDGGVLSRTGPIVRQSTVALAGLANGTHTLEVLGQDMAGNWQDNDPAKTIEGLPQVGPATATWTVNTALQLVRINEIAANTPDGNDWVELYNAGAAAIDVGGWALAETASGGGAITLPGTVIPSGGTAVFSTAGIGLALDKDGDSIFLLDPSLVVKDSISFGTQPSGYSLGRIGPAAAWTLNSLTSGSPNMAAPVAVSNTTLRITEIHAASVISYKDDWIEVQNTGALPVNVSGLVLTDNRAGNPGSVIPPHSYIAGNGFAVFLADNTLPPAGNHLSFALDSQQENVALLTASGAVIDEVMLFPQTDDFSQTRLAGGGSAWAELATRGFSMATNDPAYINAQNIYRSLRITEIMYNAQGGSNFDWLELRNTGATAINLNGVSFDQGISFTFGNVTLNPGKNIIVCKDVASFQGRYGAAPNLGGAYTGQLDNGGETLAIRLAAPFDQNVLCFSYDDAWYLNTDGLGKSLSLVSTTTERDDYGDRNSWIESPENGGSPDGTTISTPATYTQWLGFYATADGADTDNDGFQSLVEFGLGLNPQSSNSGAGATPVAGTSADNRLQLSFALPENAARPSGHGQNEVTYAVQISTNLTAPNWNTIATKSPSTAWTGSAAVTTGAASGGFVPVVVKDTVSIPSGQRRFIRLQMTWTP